MTLERMQEMLKDAIKDGQERPQAMKQTNILNAEYAAGRCMAILDMIESLYGLDAFVSTYEAIRDQMDAFTKRAQAIYTR